MSIKESLYFTYDGINSQDLGIINCHVETGLYQEPFLANRELVQVKIRYNDKPLFQRIKKNQIEFKLSFAFEDTWDEQSIRKIARLFDKDFYAPMIFSSNPEVIYYCLCVDDSEKIHTGLRQGYLQLQFICDSSYAYSPTYSTEVYDLTDNPPEGTIITIQNKGDVPIKPVIKVEIIDGSSFSIQNMSNSGKTLSFSGLDVGEVLELNGEYEDITTSKPLTYRFDAMSGDFLELVYGVNNLKILGKIKIQFIYEYKILQTE